MTNEEAIEAIRQGLVVTRKMVADGLSALSKEELEADPDWDRDPTTGNWFKRQPEYWAARGLTEIALAEQQPFAEVALNAAVADTLRQHAPHLVCLDGATGPLAPDKARYEEIVSFLPYELVDCETSSGAIERWKDQFVRYLSEHQGNALWWRERPEILGDVPFGSTKPRWRAYARLRVGETGLIAREVAEQHVNSVTGIL